MRCRRLMMRGCCAFFCQLFPSAPPPLLHEVSSSRANLRRVKSPREVRALPPPLEWSNGHARRCLEHDAGLFSAISLMQVFLRAECAEFTTGKRAASRRFSAAELRCRILHVSAVAYHGRLLLLRLRLFPAARQRSVTVTRCSRHCDERARRAARRRDDDDRCASDICAIIEARLPLAARRHYSFITASSSSGSPAESERITLRPLTDGDDDYFAHAARPAKAPAFSRRRRHRDVLLAMSSPGVTRRARRPLGARREESAACLSQTGTYDAAA